MTAEPPDPSPAPSSTAWAQARALLGDLRRSPSRGGLLRLAGGVAGVLIANAVLQIGLNAWQGAFFDALSRVDFAAFLRQLGVFAALVAGLLSLVVAQTWLQETLKVGLRFRLTDDLGARWLAPARAYRLALSGPIGEHPDQRLHEDARKLCDLTVDLAAGLLQATLMLASFIGVLWYLSEKVTLTLGGAAVVVPGYLVWCALGFSATGSVLAWRVGRPLVGLNERRYGLEADLRFELVRVADAAEGVALYRGEPDERRRIGAALDRVTAAAQRIADRLARLTWVTSGYGWVALVAPILAAAPGYFGRSMTFGELMMVVGAFGQVQSALRWYVDNYARIADWRATLLRVGALRAALAEIAAAEAAGDGLRVAPHPAGRFGWRGLRVGLPGGGVAALDPEEAEVRPGERVAILGDARSGKSSVFRAFAGLASEGAGLVLRPPVERMMFLPNRPYLPPGRLAETVAYPGEAARFGEAAIGRALERVGLGRLVEALGRAGRWDLDLPLDEQQRVVLARALLHRPDWLIMDDALAALGAEQRGEAFAALDEALPRAAIVALARREPAPGVFDRLLRVRRADDAPAPALAAS